MSSYILLYMIGAGLVAGASVAITYILFSLSKKPMNKDQLIEYENRYVSAAGLIAGVCLLAPFVIPLAAACGSITGPFLLGRLAAKRVRAWNAERLENRDE